MPRRKKHNIELDGLPKLLGAEVYQESPGFICLLPNDVHESVVGKGSSVAEAVDNWDVKLQAHLRNAGEDDPVVIFVKGLLVKTAHVEKTQASNTIRKSREQNIAEFESQFYSSRRKN
ncbi:hypothetical protein [Pedobacter agri]|uniref:Uncharacterized protein n=1 Tax=Pedobacter agri TaxID=454586 RepID=A0A9X3DEU4_9SPHI|nr:hypothetical protein [Pedobacter agri]MCX3264831.1 hypothetical protein [Pedobacter agri]